jgi:hypothetical protein
VALFAVPHPCFSRVFCDVFTANGEVTEWLKAAVCCEGGGLLNRNRLGPSHPISRRTK